jgi:hypothetical protein
MSVESLYQKGNDEYATPEWIKQGLFKDFFDPCPLTNGLVSNDGLASSWPYERIFINPPYSQPLPWIERAILESKKGKTVALLVKHDSSTKWFAKLHEAGAHFLPILERLHFNNMKGAAPFPSVIAILYPSFPKKDIKQETQP